MLQQLPCRTSKHIGANPSCVKGKPGFCIEESPLFSPREVCVWSQTRQTSVWPSPAATVKPWGQPAWTCHCPPAPCLGTHGRGGFGSRLQEAGLPLCERPKGTSPAGLTEQSGLCHPPSRDVRLGQPSLSVSPAKPKAVPAQGSSATGLAQQRRLRAKITQHRTASGKSQEWLITAMN